MTGLKRVCETIRKVRGHFEGDQIRVEADVRSYALSPLLRDLGWNPEDPGSVKREYPVTGGKSYFFDYALLAADGSVTFVIEAKAPGKLDAGAGDQLLVYTARTETRLGLATDGEIWSFYLPLAGGSWEQRLVRTVNLRDDTAESVGNVLWRYLARDRVLAGQALEAASGDLVRRRLHRIIETGWSDLLDGPKDKLVKAIAASAKAAATRRGGEAPTGRALNKEVRAFIQHGFCFPDKAGAAVVAATARRVAGPPAQPSRAAVPPKAKRGVSWTLRGETRTAKNPTDLYVAVIRQLYELRRNASFYQQLQEKIRGHKLAQIAQSPEKTGAPKYARRLPGGWHINTKLSTAAKLSYLKRACDVAGVAFGSELVIDIGGSHRAEGP